MKFMYKLITGVILMTLVLFSGIEKSYASMPLTETIYTLPVGNIELNLSEEFCQVNDFYMRESLNLGVGVFNNFSVWLKMHFLHGGMFSNEKDRNALGDIFLKLWFYIGDYCKDNVHIGIMLKFRFPTGDNAYAEPYWRSLSLGKNEIILGPVMQFDIRQLVFLHLNVFYVFREGEGEDFYGGFYLNPIDEDTYKKLFGFNPFEDGAFMSYKRLRNDYIMLSFAVNTNVIYPVIPYMEFYYSVRLYRGKISTGSIPIEGAGIDPFLISMGLRYFFNRAGYIGLYVIQNPLQEMQDDYLKGIYGIDFSMQF